MRTIRQSRITVAILIAGTALVSACSPNPGTDTALDPANELPFGTVDYPLNNAQVGPGVPIAGWALDDRGIREIRFYIDGHFQTSVPLNTERPDVSKAMPSYAKGGNRHGWTHGIMLDQPGDHTVVVQAVDTDGATRDIGVLKLTLKQ